MSTTCPTYTDAPLFPLEWLEQPDLNGEDTLPGMEFML